MRIGIDIRALMEGKTTGVEVYIINLLHALFQLDHENEYILFANSFRDTAPKLRRFEYPNVSYRIFRWPNKIFNLLQKFFGWPKVDKMLGGLDLFFSPHFRVVALNKNIPVVTTFHDLSFEIFPEFFTLWRRFWHPFMNYRKAAQSARKLIAVSENTKKDLVELYGIPPEKIEVIYSGARLSSISSRPRGLEKEKYFFCLGTFEPRKNLDAVMTAYKEYFYESDDPLPLVLAGAKGWKTKLPQMPPEAGKNICILQNVDEEEKSYLYQHAFALLSLSFYEGFGFPILEAAACGVPVIASYGTSHDEIGKDFALFVNPFRSTQVAAGMLNLEKDDKLYQEMKSRGLESAKKFNWQKTAVQTLELLKKL